jgi:transposase
MKKVYSREFKFKVAIEAIKGDLTIVQIMSKYQVAESLVHRWKKQVLDTGCELFGKGKATNQPKSPSEDIDKLHAAIGKLKIENDFLEHVLLQSKNRSGGK